MSPKRGSGEEERNPRQQSGSTDVPEVTADQQHARLQQQVREREALLKISHAVQSMTRSEDLSDVAMGCHAGLRQVGLDVQVVAMHRIVDPDTRVVETYRVGPDGMLAAAERRRSTQLIRVWREGVTDYVPDEEAILARSARPKDDLEAFRQERYEGMPIRAILDVPASQVVVSALSIPPDAFSSSEIETVKSVAEVLSLGVARLADLEQLEAQGKELVKVERMRALGEISAGISHNLNNLLTGVIGPAELLKMRITDPDALGYADLILRSASRATELIRRLAAAASGGEEKFQAVRVRDVVEEAVDASRPLWKDASEAKGIRIDLETEVDPLVVARGSRTGLFDILVNLLTNAVDAMPSGGTITIRARVDDDIVLTVRDTGIGMDGETVRRVFAPFFTTKMDVGSGLGLSTARGTVVRWGGTIDVESELGSSTTFTIRLPVGAGSVAETDEPDAEALPRQGRILLVDDDETVRSVLSDMLSEGHVIDTAADGPGALKLFQPKHYDVALIDLGMPGLPGDQVAREIQRIDPTVSTVLITGWELEPDDPRSEPFDFRLMKPFGNYVTIENVIARAMALHDERAGRSSGAS